MASFESTAFDSSSFDSSSFDIEVAEQLTGGTLEVPIGPGFFIFFQHQSIPSKKGVYRGKTDRDRVLKEDDELLDLIIMLASSDII